MEKGKGSDHRKDHDQNTKKSARAERKGVSDQAVLVEAQEDSDEGGAQEVKDASGAVNASEDGSVLSEREVMDAVSQAGQKCSTRSVPSVRRIATAASTTSSARASTIQTSRHDVNLKVPGAQRSTGIEPREHRKTHANSASRQSNNTDDENPSTCASVEGTMTMMTTATNAQIMEEEIVDDIQPMPIPPPPVTPTLPGAMAVGGTRRRTTTTSPGCFAHDEEQATVRPHPTHRNDDTGIGAAENNSEHEQEGVGDYLVEATLVSSDRNMEPPRRTTTAGIIVEALPVRTLRSNRFLLFGVCLLMLLIFLLGVGFGAWRQEEDGTAEEGTLTPTFVPSTSPSQSPTENPKPTLQQVRDRGVLRCGHDPFIQEFFEFLATIDYSSLANNNNASNQLTTPYAITGSGGSTGKLDEGICKAIAAAINGVGAPYELVEIEYHQLDESYMLANGTVDVQMKSFPNMQSDVFEPDIGQGISYSVPFLVMGLGFSGKPEYVHCAEDDIKTFFNCSDIRICVEDSSAFLDELYRRIPHRQIVPVHARQDITRSFVNGTCNVVATEAPSVMELLMRNDGYNGTYLTGTKEFTRELHAIATLEDDPEWSDFVNAVVLSLFAAELQNITQTKAEQMGETSLFGDEYRRMFINAVQTTGNFMELYNREVGIFVRPASNKVNNGTTGLLYSLPVGLIQKRGPMPLQGSTLRTIRERDMLNCGVRGGRPGFAMYDEGRGRWVGLDVDYCQALASSLFDGMSESVHLEILDSSSMGYELLTNGTIDVFAGAVWTLENDIREPTTSSGFSFTKPYFYAPLTAHNPLRNVSIAFDPNLALATREDDPQWSSFVFWVANALVFAEEMGTTQRLSSAMPIAKIFGNEFSRMLPNAVHAVGNYGELYSRHVERHLARSERNLLNVIGESSPVHYIPPGFFA